MSLCNLRLFDCYRFFLLVKWAVFSGNIRTFLHKLSTTWIRTEHEEHMTALCFNWRILTSWFNHSSWTWSVCLISYWDFLGIFYCLRPSINAFLNLWWQKPIIPADLYRTVRDSQLIGLSGFSKEVLSTPNLHLYIHIFEWPTRSNSSNSLCQSLYRGSQYLLSVLGLAASTKLR